jgi:site-specific DNA recombinase
MTADEVLAAWAERSGRLGAPGADRGGLRFAFYGRVSTEDWQDPVSSRARQREQAKALVRGLGIIVGEFFDEGYSRSVAWGRPPTGCRPDRRAARPRARVGRGRHWRV